MFVVSIRDTGQSPWMVFAPSLLVMLAFDLQLDYFSLGETGDGLINWLATLGTAH